jgi:hypothetical protein
MTKRRAADHRAARKRPQSDGPITPAVKRIYRPVTRKQRTFYVSDALYGQIRSAVVNLAGPPEHLTMTAFFERAAQRELGRLHRKHHNGKPFPSLPDGMRPRPGARPAGAGGRQTP